MARKIIGTATTDSNGVAVLSDGYTGTGAGLVDFGAETTIDSSTVVSGTFIVYDCTWYDKDGATWSNSRVTKTFTDGVRKLETGGSAQNSYANNDRAFTGDLICEFDVVGYSSASDVSLRAYYYSSSQGQSRTSSFAEINIGIGSHVIIEAKNGTFKFIVDGDTKQTINYDISNGLELGFRLNANKYVEFSNYRVYPI